MVRFDCLHFVIFNSQSQYSSQERLHQLPHKPTNEVLRLLTRHFSSSSSSSSGDPQQLQLHQSGVLPGVHNHQQQQQQQPHQQHMLLGHSGGPHGFSSSHPPLPPTTQQQLAHSQSLVHSSSSHSNVAAAIGATGSPGSGREDSGASSERRSPYQRPRSRSFR